MAIIGKIRKRSGLTIAVVGIAMFAFIIGDLSKNQNQEMVVGEIAGEDIQWQEFEQLVENNAELQRLQQRKTTLDADEMFGLRERTWTEFLENIILGEEYDALGLSVSEDELQDLVIGETPHRFIAQSFSNQTTGELDREMLINFMQTLGQRDASVQSQMENILFQMRRDVTRTKLNTLISKAYYVPSAVAKYDYDLKNRKANFSLVGLKYTDIADSAVAVTEQKMEAYYNENQKRYDQQKSCDIEYIVFDVRPSAKDRQETKEIVEDLAKEMKTISADEINSFVNSVSDQRYDSSWFAKSQVPARLDSVLFHAEIGSVFPTYLENNAYVSARLMSRQERPDSLKAQHILVAYQGAFRADTAIKRTRDEAQMLADSLQKVINRKSSKLATLAIDFSDDGSAVENNGDLGWFADGMMVPQFNEACVVNKKGSVVVEETPFGFHVILVEDKVGVADKVRVAYVKRDILASTQTRQDVYRIASTVAINGTDVQNFRETADKDHLNIRTREYLQPMANAIPSVTNPRQIIRWAFDEDVKIGDVSDVFEDDNNFVVVALTGTHAKGVAPFDQVEDQIKPIATKEVKAVTLEAKMDENKGKGMNELAAALQTKPVSVVATSMSSYNVPTFGRETKVIGAASALEVGEVLSAPIEGDNGVYMLSVTAVTPAAERADYSTMQKNLERVFASRVPNSLFRALQNETEIEDYRVRFF